MRVKEKTVRLPHIKEAREESEATHELLSIPGFNAALQTAKRQAKSGEVVRLKDIRRDIDCAQA